MQNRESMYLWTVASFVVRARERSSREKSFWFSEFFEST